MIGGADQPPPSVSIVVPVLNEAAVIEHALVRLRRDFPTCELLVVDGGSSDGTAALAARHARVLAAPHGRARQMNAGAAATHGDVLWFIHADTEIDATALGQMRHALADERVVGGGLSLRFDQRSPSLDFLARASTARAKRLHHIFGDQALFVRRSVFDALGGFPDLPLMEDLELSRRLHRLGRTVVITATSTASARRLTAHGTVRMIVFMQYLKLRYLIGADAERLNLRYQRGPGLRLPAAVPASVDNTLVADVTGRLAPTASSKEISRAR